MHVLFIQGIETFYGALVWRSLDLLQDREKSQHSADWVLNEALNVTSLHHGGTFQNVVAKKLDQVLTWVFANILSFVDCYHNLDLISNLQSVRYMIIINSIFCCNSSKETE